MRAPAKGQGNKIDPAKTDVTAALSDLLLQRILLAVPETARAPCGLVCHRWLRIVGNLHRSLRLLDWQFLESGRLAKRFPHLTDIDLTWACMRDVQRKHSILISHSRLSLPIFPIVPTEEKSFTLESCIRSQQINGESLDKGLIALASGCPDLQRLLVVDVSNNHATGGSFSEWEFVSSNEKLGQKSLLSPNGQKVVLSFNDRTGQKELVSLISPEEIPDLKDLASNEKTVQKSEEAVKAEGRKDGQDGAKTGKEGDKTEKGDGGKELGGTGGGKVAGVEEMGKVGSKDEGFMKTLEDNAGKMEVKKVPSRGSGHVRAESGSDGELGKKGLGKGARQGEAGLAILARGCPLLQEVEVHQCTDETVSALGAYKNVQILRLVGTIPGLSSCSFTDVGLTILANRCRRLIKLELTGCEASFAGIAAIGQCCMMLEELMLSSTGFQEGWISALGCFGSLRTLRLESCKYIDRKPGPAEHLERCKYLERLQLVCCDLRDRVGFGGLLTVCSSIRSLEFQDCWGLDDDCLALAKNCRKVGLLSLDGCSLVTAAGLESVALTWKELQRLRVVYCSSIRDSELSPDFGDVVVMLKEFRWRPDTKNQLSGTTAIAQTGRWFFNRA